MERLSGLDATFLYLETPTHHMHVAMTGIYDTSTMPGGYSFERLRDHILARLHLLGPRSRNWRGPRSPTAASPPPPR